MTTKRGWCPTLFEPMAAGDGLLVRVKPRLATITAAQARVIADASRRFGNGLLGLTNRGNIQVRGLSETNVPEFARAIVATGLADADPEVERRRNVLVSPLVGDDPAIHPATELIAGELETRLTAPGFSALPGKFGIAIDGGGALPIGAAHADIAIALDGDIARISLPDGTGAVCPLADTVAVCAALIRLCLDVAPGGRMSDSTPLISAAEIFAHVGLQEVGSANVPSAACAVGFLPYPLASRGAFGVAPPFGRLNADTLDELCGIADRHGDATLRITPFRTVMLPGIAADRTALVAAACEDAGMIVDSGDPRLRVVACPGTPDCAQATVEAFADAARIASLGLRRTIHVSGCAKGCAQAGVADITLVGRAGTYDLVRNGRARDVPVRTSLTIANACAVLADNAA